MSGRKKDRSALTASASIAKPAGESANIADCEPLLDALDRFVSAHSSFESSKVDTKVRDDLGRAGSLAEASLVPMRHKIFSFETALMWGFFLHIGGRKVAEDNCEDPTVSSFNLERFTDEIASIYDRAVDENVWAVVNEEEDSDEESDEESEEE